MSVPNLSQEELVQAFKKYMPKRHNYPPLVPDDDVLSNSDTDSDGSDGEYKEMDKVMCVFPYYQEEMTKECQMAYQHSSCKTPVQYLRDNTFSVLSEALGKLVNLRVKPKNPIEWLGYCLMNMHISIRPEAFNPYRYDHLIKPIGTQLDYVLKIEFNPQLLVDTFRYHRFNTGDHERSSSGKRKITNKW